jgi:hypothetical protein
MAAKSIAYSFLRAELTESAAGTYTEEAIPTNLSISRSVLMKVMAIRFEFYPGQHPTLPTGLGAGMYPQYLEAQICDESQTAIINLGQEDQILKMIWDYTQWDTLAAPVSGGMIGINRIKNLQIDPPFPYVKPYFFFGVKANNATAFTGPCTVGIRVAYYLEKVSDTEYMRMLLGGPL